MEVGVPLPMDHYKNKLIIVTDCFVPQKTYECKNSKCCQATAKIFPKNFRSFAVPRSLVRRSGKPFCTES